MHSSCVCPAQQPDPHKGGPPVPRHNVQSGRGHVPRAVNAVGHSVGGAGRDVAQPQGSCLLRSRPLAPGPQLDEPVDRLLEQPVTPHLGTPAVLRVQGLGFWAALAGRSKGWALATSALLLAWCMPSCSGCRLWSCHAPAVAGPSRSAQDAAVAGRGGQPQPAGCRGPGSSVAGVSVTCQLAQHMVAWGAAGAGDLWLLQAGAHQNHPIQGLQAPAGHVQQDVLGMVSALSLHNLTLDPCTMWDPLDLLDAQGRWTSRARQAPRLQDCRAACQSRPTCRMTGSPAGMPAASQAPGAQARGAQHQASLVGGPA